MNVSGILQRAKLEAGMNPATSTPKRPNANPSRSVTVEIDWRAANVDPNEATNNLSAKQNMVLMSSIIKQVLEAYMGPVQEQVQKLNSDMEHARTIQKRMGETVKALALVENDTSSSRPPARSQPDQTASVTLSQQTPTQTITVTPATSATPTKAEMAQGMKVDPLRFEEVMEVIPADQINVTANETVLQEISIQNATASTSTAVQTPNAKKNPNAINDFLQEFFQDETEGNRCAVPGCYGRFSHHESETHRIPSKDPFRMDWMTAVPALADLPHKEQRICFMHFNPIDVNRDDGTLRRKSVPSRFLDLWDETVIRPGIPNVLTCRNHKCSNIFLAAKNALIQAKHAKLRATNMEVRLKQLEEEMKEKDTLYKNQIKEKDMQIKNLQAFAATPIIENEDGSTR